MLFSPDDDFSQPSEQLIRVALEVIQGAITTDLGAVSDRMAGPHRWPDTWPGEHYRFLAALVEHLQPSVVVEIGTFTGLSSLSLLQTLPPDGKLVSFDIEPWEEIPDTCLRKEDFADGRFQQVVADLSRPEVAEEYRNLLGSASLIFADGPKDGNFEPRFAELLDTITFDSPPYVVFDDIKDWNMLAFWRKLTLPKLDLTSFGHWTGTGLVQWGG
jgi:predicted O-methyltransferase YrrM